MRETTKMTVPYQFGYILMGHIVSSGVVMILTLIAFLWALEKPVLKEILGSIFVLSYALAIYGRAAEMAKRDNKPYSRLKPDMKKGVLFGVMISVTTFIVVLAVKFVWATYSTGNGLNNIGSILVNVFYCFWTAPYYGIMGLSKGMVTWYSYVLFAVVPILSTTLGYLAGCKGFEILTIVSRLQYEPSKKK